VAVPSGHPAPGSCPDPLDEQRLGHGEQQRGAADQSEAGDQVGGQRHHDSRRQKKKAQRAKPHGIGKQEASHASRLEAGPGHRGAGAQGPWLGDYGTMTTVTPPFA